MTALLALGALLAAMLLGHLLFALLHPERLS
jgi:K+-transporting ATPase KdpF subunit